IASSHGLQGLTTRRDDDYAIGLLDLWAALADVLTFYQERYANEAFLRTATQRESIARLARLLDYRLAPGAAATTQLAFTRDGGNYPPEQKHVRSSRVADAGVLVEWTEPVGRTWPADSVAFVLGRTFRLFGHNVPPSWMEPSIPDSSDPTRVVWSRQKTVYTYPSDPDEAVATESKGIYKSRLVLDGRYDGLASGQALLVVLPDKTPHEVTS